MALTLKTPGGADLPRNEDAEAVLKAARHAAIDIVDQLPLSDIMIGKTGELSGKAGQTVGEYARDGGAVHPDALKLRADAIRFANTYVYFRAPNIAALAGKTSNLTKEDVNKAALKLSAQGVGETAQQDIITAVDKEIARATEKDGAALGSAHDGKLPQPRSFSIVDLVQKTGPGSGRSWR